MINMQGNECGRCNINCSEYVSESVRWEDVYDWSGINIRRIEAAFYERNFLDLDVQGTLRNVIEAARRSPIYYPSQACLERLAIFCCSEREHAGYIFYNIDRINEYIDGLTNSIVLLTLADMSRAFTKEVVAGLIKDKYRWDRLLNNVKKAVRYVITSSIMLHERFHWAEGCGSSDRCDAEARATAYQIVRTIDLIRGRRFEDWAVQPPLNLAIQPTVNLAIRPYLMPLVYNLFDRIKRKFILLHDLSTLFALELSVESILLTHSRLPCYSRFYNYLGSKNRILGSIDIHKADDRFSVISLPWIGVNIGFNYHDHDHFHVSYDTEDNVYLNLDVKAPPRVKDLKEVWVSCQ
ncbi:hypothetical protein GWK48_10435 [Metallosphaera tengchongensis]|uniref:Uncharacterized protein n=1 Tax=Metallosphaera tengchongensis TaxID=1532350 RepID=A0A6N0P0F2_9CREN|nr:hypothetical protein [Metallosphaera tengchongensis]QKR00750.1 hypothetical protein GWK48_10435 [Metallosphaera tengchongensis]